MVEGQIGRFLDLMAIPMTSFRYFMESIDGEGSYWYLGEHGRAMVARYRDEARRRFGDNFFSAGNNFGSPMKSVRRVRREGMPIFWEFVKYVINEPMSKLPFEWSPINSYCGPCEIKYEITGKSISRKILAKLKQMPSPVMTKCQYSLRT